MNRSIITMLVSASTLVVAAVMGAEEVAESTPDHQLGLSKGRLTEVADPPVEKKNQTDPGDGALRPPDYADQPTLVPHTVTEFLPITMEENLCVDCHAVEEKVEGEPTPIPVSHYTDLRNSPDIAADEIVGGRYVCVLCHVSPGENETLVGNSYTADR